MSKSSFFGRGMPQTAGFEDFTNLVKTLETQVDTVTALGTELQSELDSFELDTTTILNQISTSTTQALVSATNAAKSVQDMTVIANGIGDSAERAESSAAAAATTATTVAAFVDTATTKASEAATSAGAAKTSQDAAKASETAAATSATTATTKAAEAATSASNAAASATDANTAKSAAAGSATAAASSASNASGSATAAATSAGNANTSEHNASTSEANAAGSATTATTQAGIATTKAGEAATSATNAASSATDANQAKLDAKTYADQAANAAQASTTGQVQSDWTMTTTTDKSYILHKPVFAAVATSGSFADLTNKPVFAAVATSGSYADLTNKPVIPLQYTDALARAAISVSGSLAYNATTGVLSYTAPALATVATSGAYADLTGKPTVPTDNSQLTNGAGFITSAGVPVQSVAGRTGAVTLAKSDVGLGNVDNTADTDKPVSTAQQSALNAKESQANKNASNGYAGLTGYNLTLNNSTGAVLSTLGSNATASRSWNLPDKDGTLATTSDIQSGTSILMPSGSIATLSAGSYLLAGNVAFQAPDLTNPVNLSITNPGNSATVASSFLTVDNWTVKTNFAAGVQKQIAPMAFGSKHGWWGNLPMSPPASFTRPVSAQSSTIVSSFENLLISSAQAGNTLLTLEFRQTEGATDIRLVITPINTLTGEIGVPYIFSNGGAFGAAGTEINQIIKNSAIFATGNGTFMVVYGGTSSYSYFAGSFANNAITAVGTAAVVSSAALVIRPVQLSNSNIITVTGTTSWTTSCLAISNSTTLAVTRTSIDTPTYAQVAIRVCRVNDTTAIISNPLGSSSTASAGGYTAFKVFTLTNPASGAGTVTAASTLSQTSPTDVSSGSGSGGSELLIPTPFPNTFIFGTPNASDRTKGNWYVLTVTGTTVKVTQSILASTFSTANTWAARYIPVLAKSTAACIQTIPLYLWIDNTRLLISGYDGKIMIASFDGTTLTFGSFVVVTPGNSSYSGLVTDSATGTNVWYTNTTTSVYGKLTIPTTGVAGLAVESTIAGLMYTVFDNNFNDAAVNLGGNWYAWTGFPKAHHPINANQYLNFATSNMTTYLNTNNG